MTTDIINADVLGGLARLKSSSLHCLSEVVDDG